MIYKQTLKELVIH